MLSIVVLTKNEEKNIVDCLESAIWADEIIVIDDFSTDRTLEIIKNYDDKKIKIFQNHLDFDFAKQKNFGLSKATKKWVLFVDADERVSSELKEEINSLIINNTEKYAGYLIRRIDHMWNKTLLYGEVGKIFLPRLIKKGSGAWVGKVHENLIIDGKIGELEGVLNHFPHQTINEFLDEINFYSSIRANELFGSRVKVNTRDILLYPLGKFIVNYIFKLGFLDKVDGLLFALMMSLHSFLVRAKLWQLWQKKSTF